MGARSGSRKRAIALTDRLSWCIAATPPSISNLAWVCHCRTLKQAKQQANAEMETTGATIKARQRPDGAIVQEPEVGATRPFSHHCDWERVDAMTDAEVEANALADPDNPPLTASELQQMRPVPNTREIQTPLHLTQEQFAAQFHLPIATIRDWEQGRREPDTAARNLLRVIARNPQAVIEALRR